MTGHVVTSAAATRPGRSRRPTGHPTLAVALLAGLIAALAGCDSTSDSVSAPPSQTATVTPSRSTSPSAAASGAASRPAPLTGVAVSAAVAGRAAVAVVLRSTAGPQDTSGLSAADLVYEEFPATSVSRQVAIFQSRDAGLVGPVGPTMPLDRKVGTVFGGVFAYSGGTPKFVKMLDKAPMTTLNALARPDLFTARAGSTFAQPTTLRSAAAKPTAPKTVFSFASSIGPTASVAPKKTTTAIVTTSTGMREEWTHFPDRLWRRTLSGRVLRAADGSAMAVANLLFQLTSYQKVYVKSSTGSTVPTANVLGTGSATVCAATGCLAGSWQRRGYEASTNFFDSKRSAVRLSRGTTWIVLAPTGSTLLLK